MKVKKIAKRLRRLSDEFQIRALNYDGYPKEAECARLFTISDVFRLLADELSPGSAAKRNKKGNKRGPITPVKDKDGAIMGWKKGQDLPGKAVD